MYIIDLLCWYLIIVYVVDCSGFIESLKLFVSNYLTKGKIRTTKFSLKPLTCSLCLTLWFGLGYLLITDHFESYNLLLVCVLSFLTPATKDLLFICREQIIKLINNDK